MTRAVSLPIGLLRSTALAAGLVLAAIASSSQRADAQQFNRITREVKYEQKLDQQVPLDVRFRDSTGVEVRLGDLIHDRPVILSLVYYECPMLCTQVLNGLSAACGSRTRSRYGDDYDVVTVSIEPGREARDAAKKKAGLRPGAGQPGRREGLALPDRRPGGDHRARRVGRLHYFLDERDQGEYAHAGGVVVLTPRGRVSRYFIDVVFPKLDLRLALVESSEGKIGTFVDAVTLLCYQHDPGDRQVWARDHERRPTARSVDRRPAPLLHPPHVAQGARQRARLSADRRRLLAGTDTHSHVERHPPRTGERVDVRERRFDLLYWFLGRPDRLLRRRDRRRRRRAVRTWYRKCDDRKATQIEGSLVLELMWTGMPLVIVIALFAWGTTFYVTMQKVPQDCVDMYVVGKQWMWKVQHPSGRREIQELHVPTGQAIRLDDDVRGRDPQLLRPRVPHEDGRGARTLHQAWFEATKAGKYRSTAPVLRGTVTRGMVGRVMVLRARSTSRLARGSTGGRRGRAASRVVPSARAATRSTRRRSDIARRSPAAVARRRDGRSVPTSRAAARSRQTTSYIRESVRVAAGEGRRRVSAGDAFVRRAGSE